jgi:hypothetical protein
LAALGEELGRAIEVRARPGQHQEQFEVMALDEGPPLDLDLPWLRDPKAAAEKAAARQAEGDAEESPDAERAGDEDSASLLDFDGEDDAPEAADPERDPFDHAVKDPPAEDETGTPPGEEGAQALASEVPDDDEEEAPERDPAARAGVRAGAGVEAAAAAPEVLDAVEENPIIPRSEETEES